MSNYYSQVMPNDQATTLYIRKGPKSRLFGLAAHTRSMVKINGKLGPSQSSRYLGMFDTFEEAMAAFNKFLPMRLIAWRRDDP